MPLATFRWALLGCAVLIVGQIVARNLQASPLGDLDSSFKATIPDDDLSLPSTPESITEGATQSPADAANTSPVGQSGDLLAAARQAFTKKEIAACLELLTIAKAQQPNLPPPRLILADLYYQANVRSAGQAMLEQVAQEDPTHPELWRLFGSVALTERRWTEAIMHFQHGLELPAPSIWTPEQRAAFILSAKKGLSVAAERRGDLRMAAQTLGELAEMAPGDSKLRDRWASVLFKAGMKEKALEQFKIAYFRDDKMAAPELSMGIMYVNDGDFEQGDHWFARATKTHPANATLHFQIAVALMVQDRAEEAARHADKAAELKLDSADLNMVRGYASRQLGAYDAAEGFFRKALQEKQDDASAMNQLALVLVEQRQPEKQQEAFDLASKLAQARENSANAQATLGWVLYRMGKVSEAEAIFRDVVKKPDIGPEALYLAGRAFSDQGNASDAANVANKLASRIALPGIYVLRPVARKWLEQQAETTTAATIP